MGKCCKKNLLKACENALIYIVQTSDKDVIKKEDAQYRHIKNELESVLKSEKQTKEK